MVDLNPVAHALLALAAAAFTAAMPFLVPGLRRLVGVNINAAQAAVIDAAVKRGAGTAYHLLLANNATIADVPLRNAALATGVEYVLRMVPATLKAFGLTPDHVEAMVSAELARLVPGAGVAAVGVGVASPVTPPAPRPVDATPDQSGAAIARVLGMFVLLAAVGGAVSACTAQQQAQATVAIQIACQVDGSVQPIAAGVVSSLGPAAAAAASTDSLLVHPAIVSACKSLGGTPVVTTPGATGATGIVVVPAATPVLAAPATATAPAAPVAPAK